MPLGFKGRPRKSVSEAIRIANDAGVLVFAAPSNWGNMWDLAFPGYLYTTNEVLCMFATRPNCKPDDEFNPVAIHSGYNFAILGKDVKVPGMDGLQKGTSIATVIGAAFAARIIDFSMHPDCRGKIDEANSLRTVEGMSAVFGETAILDLKYDCMRPWILMPEEGQRDMDRKAKRQYICETISRALKNRYKGVNRRQ